MPFRPVQLPPGVPGALWLSAMPGRLDSWPAFEAKAERARLALVVCLTPRDEVAELSPAYDAALTRGQLPFRWLNLPIPNFGLPPDRDVFRREIRDISQALQEGQAVMLHCAAGIGRTGTTAACVLKALGMDAVSALQRIRDAGSNPENALQSGLVEWF